jgi:sulfate transport system permease protein
VTGAQLTGDQRLAEPVNVRRAPAVAPARARHWPRLAVRFIGLAYLALLLAVPVGLIFVRTFASGLDPVLKVVNSADFQHAFWLTVTLAIIAVPINTVFGVITALALVRRKFPGRGLLNAIIDLPFALSPVVIGLSLLLVYGQKGWLGGWLNDMGFQVIFAMPSMVLATIFVSLPFVVREVVPVLREIGTDQEEAAYTLGASAMRTFWRVTLPSIRWGVIYGVVLTTARSLGEFGAVSVVSGRLSGKTETLTLYVEQRYSEFDLIGAYTAAVVLALLAVAVLLAMNALQSGRGTRAREWVTDLLRLNRRKSARTTKPTEV